MINFQIDTLPIITNSQPNTGYLLQTPIKGLESPKYRTDSSDRPGIDGSRVTGQFYGSRIIDLTGLVYDQSSASNFEILRQKLGTAVSIKKNIYGEPIPTKVTLTTLGGNNYFFNAFFEEPEMPLETINASTFQLVCEVPDAYIFSTTLIDTGTVMPPSTGGYVVPMVLPYVSAGSVGGSVTVNNPGQVDVYPIVNLTGPLTNPIMYNQTTGAYIQLNYTLPAGNTIRIDMANQLVTLNNSSSAINTKSLASSWWQMVKGVNVISLQTSNSSDTGYASAQFYPGYLTVG